MAAWQLLLVQFSPEEREDHKCAQKCARHTKVKKTRVRTGAITSGDISQKRRSPTELQTSETSDGVGGGKGKA